MKAVMGKWTYSAQYQQDPIPEGGAIFQREWFSHRFQRDPDTGLPLGAKLRMVIQSWDTAAKKTIRKLDQLRAAHLNQQHSIRWHLRNLPEKIDDARQTLDHLHSDTLSTTCTATLQPVTRMTAGNSR
jgi:hypothetical protein